MKKSFTVLYLVFVSALCALLAGRVEMAFAATSPETTTRLSGPERAQNNVPVDESGADIVLLLDCSGKMKQIDPYDFRKPAAKLFISLLDESDTISIIGFGDTIREIAPQTRNTRANRAKLLSGIDNIIAKEFNTNITEALRKAFETLKPRSRKNRAIILLSDGMLDLGSPAKNEKSYKELKQLLPEIGKTGIKIHSITFTELADSTLLHEAATATNGTVALARSDKDLHVIFASTFEKIKTPDEIPLRGDSFLVDKNIREIILMITKKPGTHTALTDPFGQGHVHEKSSSNITWYKATAFDMITIVTPEVGAWKVRLSSTEGNKIYIITDLKLMSSFRREVVAVAEQITVDAWLEKQGVLLNDPEILEQVAFSAEVTTPENKNVVLHQAAGNQPGEGGAKKGMYFWNQTPPTLGEYHVILKAVGKTFQREKTIQFRVVETVVDERKQKRYGEGGEPANGCQDAVQWKSVLIQFALINLLFVCLSASGYFIYWLIMQRKNKKAPARETHAGPTAREEKKA